MKKLIAIALLCLFFMNTGFSQGDNNERIQAARKAYFENALQLTDEESDQFWPLFEQYQKDQQQLKTSYKANRKIELMSDDEVKDHIFQTLELEEKQIDLKREYIKKMMNVLPIRKIALLRKTERQFKRELLERVKERRQNRRKNQRGN